MADGTIDGGGGAVQGQERGGGLVLLGLHLLDGGCRLLLLLLRLLLLLGLFLVELLGLRLLRVRGGSGDGAGLLVRGGRGLVVDGLLFGELGHGVGGLLLLLLHGRRGGGPGGVDVAGEEAVGC